MFIASLTYKKPISEVEKYLEEHIEYLKKYYEAGNFIVSGRKNPRVGGVILVRCNSREELDEILGQDPFFKNDIANYEITEFEASMYCDAFASLV